MDQLSRTSVWKISVCLLVVVTLLSMVLSNFLLEDIMALLEKNGTAKTTFLRYMAMHAIDGIPRNCQILHVQQEIVGDDNSVLQCILNTDLERVQLLEEEDRLLALKTEAVEPVFNRPFRKRKPFENGHPYGEGDSQLSESRFQRRQGMGSFPRAPRIHFKG